jgi:small subunit ribosomal protein S9
MALKSTRPTRVKQQGEQKKSAARPRPAKAAAAKRQPTKAAPPAAERGDIRAVGRRKSAVARLRLNVKGEGRITVNGKDYRQYFPYWLWQETVAAPLPLVGLAGAADVSASVAGGGLPAQADAVRLALARALVSHNPDWRPTLRKMGWLTRDPREKERKKPGLKRARRAPQWQKR